MECDIAIIGAGVSGLAAAAKLTAAGKKVICLEATDRIGGRILTVHDPLAPVPVELGAEFVHGLPPETWDIIRQNNLTAYEHSALALHLSKGRIQQEKDNGELANRVLENLQKSKRKKDESFAEHLQRSRQPEAVKAWTRVHIEGFNAAREEVISVASLKKDADAAERIEGDRSFHILNGYDSIPHSLLRSIPGHQSLVSFNTIVEGIVWRRGSVDVHCQPRNVIRCRKVIVTVPLAVLQGGAIRFEPEPRKALDAAATLCSGHVYRLTFRFREAFWADDDEFKKAGFFLSKDRAFFAWWTTHPIISPVLTGWCAGSAAEQFRGASHGRITAAALDSLGRILDRGIPRPDAVHFHDWQQDPFFRCAYSYAPVNGLAARRALAKPVGNTLFFAGEATNAKGHASTVHGAIASGVRAAEECLT
jgi:monoamine oxidase